MVYTAFEYGISAGFYLLHDSAVVSCIEILNIFWLKNGEIIAAAQEERFSRKKGDARFPKDAIAYCLNEARITPQEIDYIVFYEKPYVKFERLLETYLAYSPDGFESFKDAIPLWAQYKLDIPTLIKRELKDIKEKYYLPITMNRMQPVHFSVAVSGCCDFNYRCGR
jgi:predicted NodU family carbamoyl transferase